MTGLDLKLGKILVVTITEENQRRKDHIHWIIFPAQDGDGTLDFEEFVKIMM